MKFVSVILKVDPGFLCDKYQDLVWLFFKSEKKDLNLPGNVKRNRTPWREIGSETDPNLFIYFQTYIFCRVVLIFCIPS